VEVSVAAEVDFVMRDVSRKGFGFTRGVVGMFAKAKRVALKLSVPISSPVRSVWLKLNV
jgi:hypothetical protein